MAKFNIKLAMSAAFLFCAGAVFGISVFHVAMRSRPFWGGFRRPSPSEAMLEHLSRRLELSDRQRTEMLPIIEELHRRFEEIRKDTLPQVDTAVDEAAEKAVSILTADQVSRLRELQGQLKEHLRRPPGRGRGFGGPGRDFFRPGPPPPPPLE